MNKELIFVYNADSNFFAELVDYAHKLVSPATYQCNLCKLTFGATMKEEWKNYIENIPGKVTFLHRDEFKEKYPDLADTPLPTVFEKDESGMHIIVSQEELNRPQSIAQLISLMKEKLNI